ncbi:PKD domain-containing protein [Ferruginibacter sp.]|nr:gliding motility-associated C-terminal domain-containing protein [Ferruginibacter sp.]
MKKIFSAVVLLFLFSDVIANHISGGEMIYEYLGPGGTANSKQYRITLRLFRDNNGGGAAMPTNVFIGVFNNDNNSPISGSYFDVSLLSNISVPVVPPPPCMDNPPTINYNMGTYEFTVDLPANQNGYTAAYQTCCRIFPLQNVLTQNQPAQGEGSTYICTIPGSNQLPVGNNSSPQFRTQLGPVCYNNSFIFDFGAIDPNPGDSLVYSFCNAYNRGASVNSGNVNPTAPPYQSVSYVNGFTAAVPLGPTASIDPKTGIISGIAPPAGRYVVCVCINEYRAGVLIGSHRKDFILTVSDCSLTKAQLLNTYPMCDGFTKTFSNEGLSVNIQTYFWDFGDGNTSTAASPTHTYATVGDYVLKLVLNRGLACTDSATSIVKVYPGFFPDFAVLGQCKNTPIQFSDNTVATYGTVNFWRWTFGDAGSPNNTSTVKNPVHTYPASGNYDVQFIVASDKGCIDTLLRTIAITDQPALSVSNDTLICIIDTLQLNAIGTGSFLWTPNYNINNINISNPLVSPDVTTTYRVTLTDPFGCVGNDSVRVSVVNAVIQSAQPDTTICRTDPVLLRLTSDALYYQWTENPAGNTLSNPTIKNPTATPLVTTTYTVVGSIGKCVAQNSITVTPIPYPDADAGADQTICLGQSAQLNAGGGSSYSWTPAAFLNNRLIPNPVSISPTSSVRYVVTVTDILGCPKPVKDTVIVTVAVITADAGPRDTVVVINQPLLLNATGSTNYLWSPAQWLSNIGTANPVALPQSDIEYVVRVSNDAGCFDYDSIRVKVFNLDASLYVPSAFSPNGDGNNDVFRPIMIGMKSLDIFRVYNRWGQLLYSGTDAQMGWDGTFGGKGQEAATYVWYAEGINYNNIKIKKKGYVVLIR